MSKVAITGNASGAGVFTIASPDSATDRTLTLPDETGTVITTASLNPLTSGTAVASTSGTSIDFTGIPSWVKRVTVMFEGVSTNSTSYVQVQLGDSGGIEDSSYFGATQVGSNGQQYSSGFLTDAGTGSGTSVRHGVISLVNVTGNTWAFSLNLGWSSSANAFVGGGTKTLSDALTQVRITTVNGTNTFDAGSINIMYE
jgi:hypothetical protein